MAYVASQKFVGRTQPTDSFSVTPDGSAGTDRVVVVQSVLTESTKGGLTMSACTWDGVSGHYVGYISGGGTADYRRIDTWYFLESEIPAGAANLAYTYSGSGASVNDVTITTLSGRSQTSPISSSPTCDSVTTATSVPLTFTAVADDDFVGMAFVGNGGVVISYDGSCTSRQNATLATSAWRLATKDALTAGSTTITPSWEGAYKSSSQGVLVAVAGASAAPILMGQACF